MQTIAAKAYKVGEVVFECKPIIHCLENQYKGKHCDNCLQKSDSLKKCSKCFHMYYCSRECQETDWSHHKNECKVFRHSNFRIGSLSERLLLRLWLCIKSDPKFVDIKYKTFDGTDISLKQLNVDLKGIFKDQDLYGFFVEICINFDNFGVFYERKQLLNWYSLLTPGGYTFQLKHYTDDSSKMSYSSFDPVRSIVGAGIFIQTPILGHSCVPNTNLVFNGPKLQYRVIKTIGCGQEMTAAIVDLGMDKALRHKMLSLSSIECKCDKCVHNSDKDIDYKEYNQLLADNRHNWSLIDDPIKAQYQNHDYLIDENLFMYMRAIYGLYHAHVSESLFLSFICFALYSKKSSKSLIKLWYKRIDASVRVTHGLDHPIHKLLNSVLQKSLAESLY